MVKLNGMENNRCRGCGGQITAKQKAVAVSKGHLHKDSPEDLIDFEEKSTWGYMHESCFLIAVGDPRAIFAIEPAEAA